MVSFLKISIKKFLKLLGLRLMLDRNSLILNSYIQGLEASLFRIKPEHKTFQIIDRYQNNFSRFIKASNSQFGQEILALTMNNWKRDGFFVEFGALDGKTHSNTYILEKEFGWNGIVAECGMRWEEELLRNRKCKIERSAIWKETGKELIFIDCESPGLSTLEEYRESDGHALLREKGKSYKVKTISLIDLLRKHESPKRIDYMSIDTEGSEWDILRDFPFKDYEIGVLTIEHNFNLNREKIQKLLFANGFKQIYSDLSEIEDWFVPVGTPITSEK